MKRALIFIALVTFIASCGASKFSNSTQTVDDKYKELASGKLGEDVSFTMNDAKTYVLCVSEIKGTVNQPRNMLSYMVIKISDNSAVLDNKVDGGTVEWFSETEIEVYLTPGIMRDDQTRDDFITLYNVESGESRKKKNTEQH